jgi:hypothetical protein
VFNDGAKEQNRTFNLADQTFEGSKQWTQNSHGKKGGSSIQIDDPALIELTPRGRYSWLELSGTSIKQVGTPMALIADRPTTAIHRPGGVDFYGERFLNLVSTVAL